MEFLAPLMLLGAVAVAVPIAIHLFGRQRAKVVRFGAMDFLLGTKQKTARRLRMKELVLLARCDRAGRQPGAQAPELAEALDYIRELAETFG